MPVPALATISGAITADIALAANTTVQLITIPLTVGVWFVAGMLTATGGSVAGTIILDVEGGAGGLGTQSGPQAASTELPALAGGYAHLSCFVVFTVTTAGNFQMIANASVAATAKAVDPVKGDQATGYIAVKMGYQGSAALTTVSGTIASNVSVAANTVTTWLTTASLAIGTWLLTVTAEVNIDGNTGIFVAQGTAVASFSGPAAASAALSNNQFTLGFTCLVDVTTAGSLLLQVEAGASTVFATSLRGALPASGYVAVKIA